MNACRNKARRRDGEPARMVLRFGEEPHHNVLICVAKAPAISFFEDGGTKAAKDGNAGRPGDPCQASRSWVLVCRHILHRRGLRQYPGAKRF